MASSTACYCLTAAWRSSILAYEAYRLYKVPVIYAKICSADKALFVSMLENRLKNQKNRYRISIVKIVSYARKIGIVEIVESARLIH